MVLHFFLLSILMFVTSDGSAFYDWKILIFPIILWKFRIDIILLRRPKITMQSFELIKVELIFPTCDIAPHVLDICWVKAISKELSNNLLKSIKIDGLVRKLWHVLKGFFSAFEFNQEKISKLFTVLWFPIIWTEKTHKIVLKQISLFMLIQTAKYWL